MCSLFSDLLARLARIGRSVRLRLRSKRSVINRAMGNASEPGYELTDESAVLAMRIAEQLTGPER